MTPRGGTRRPAAGGPEPEAPTAARERGVPVDEPALAAVASALAVASYRYHLAVGTYGRFFADEVLPAVGRSMGVRAGHLANAATPYYPPDPVPG